MAKRIVASPRLMRQTLALVCLLLLLLMITGLPVPRSNGKDRSTPFPCMDSHCSCSTAEQCWKQCCCHTHEEKLAWAKRNDQPIPDYVAQVEDRPFGKCDSCEYKSRHDTCCESVNVSCDSSCCEHQQVRQVSRATRNLKWISMIHALKCQGHDGWSLLANAVVVLKNDFTLELMACLPSGDVIVAHCVLRSHDTTPESPPPRHL